MKSRISTIRATDHRLNRSGISFVEILVVIGIVGVLISMALPAIGRARQASRRIQCVNNLRNISFGITQHDHFLGRLPASGYYFDPPSGPGGAHHSWAVSILPFLEQKTIYDKWDLSKPITDAANQALTQSHVPIYVCPMDLSLSKDKQGDLSYAVNGGVGFTIRSRAGVADCPLSPTDGKLDLNGDGLVCEGTETDDADRKIFKQLGVFFLENWQQDDPEATERHHSIDDLKDGTSQTFLVTENVRVGYSPDDDQASFADPDPHRSAFYIGSPCLNGDCSDGNVDYSRCNQGIAQINSGLQKPEGESPVPNSFHDGGVNMAYADGHVKFLSEQIDGGTYAALSSPQGMLLDDTPLQQAIASGGDF